MGCCEGRPPRIQEEVDVLIIGGGFSSWWFAERLHTEHPRLKVRVVEKCWRVGGRLSRAEEGDEADHSIRDELGSMRIFPECMPGVKALAERYGLTLEELHLGDDDNIFHHEGRSCRMDHAMVTGGGKWAGKHPSEMSKEALSKYRRTDHWKKCGKEAYKCEHLRGMSVPEFFKEYAGASDEDMAYWFAYVGYDYHHDDIQASIYVHDWMLYGSDHEYYDYIKEGYMRLVAELRKASQVEVSLFDRAISISRNPEDKSLSVVTDHCVFKASAVVVGVTPSELLQIDGVEKLISKKRSAILREVKAIPLFKCSLVFAESWWKRHGLEHGKTTTSGACRQIHYGEDNDLLIYNSDGQDCRHATEWHQAFLEDREQALREMFEEVRKVHMAHHIPEEDIPEPIWDKCLHGYWPLGAHRWKRGADVLGAIDSITDGSSDGSEVYIIGDAFSDMQGWVEGAMNTAKSAYTKFQSAPACAKAAGEEDTKLLAESK